MRVIDNTGAPIDFKSWVRLWSPGNPSTMRRESPLRIPLLNCFLKKPLRHLDPLKINYNLNYGPKVEYRVWNPFRSKVAASVLGGVDANWIKPGTHVLYLGAALGTTVSHVSDIVGPARILALNASLYLKVGGHFVISIKANCIDSTAPAETVFREEAKKLQAEQFKPREQVILEPYERDHACVIGLTGQSCSVLRGEELLARSPILNPVA
ncbi:hypothetical protein FXO37_03000 [Capsicum annuum]|nr:hypothetical protein FXO37_03000 [Capsicum annuum]